MSQLTELAPGTLIEQLPLFPLPDIVFFPNTLLPLQVFEPRYLTMLTDVLAGDGLIGIVQLAPGWEASYYGAPEVHQVLGVGRVVHHQTSPDERLNILLKGLARATIDEEIRTQLAYRVVRARVVAPSAGGGTAAARQVATVRHLFAALLSNVDGLDPAQAEVLFSPETEPAVVVDAIAAALPLPSREKQSLLEEPSLAARAEHLAELLLDLSVDPELGANTQH